MNLVIAQSGGPTCAINASLAGVYTAAAAAENVDHIYGARNGIEGILHDTLVDLRTVFAQEEALPLLRLTPSTVLGSCRCKLPLPEEEDAPYRAILQCLQKHEIDAFFYIGGNDSMDTVAKLSEYLDMIGSSIRVIGIPKTIDNDLLHTDHTPGFGSAAKYVAVTMSEIARDSAVYNLPSVTIVEIMGRDAGWLTAASCVLRATGTDAPHLIYLPEMPFNAERFLQDIRQAQRLHKSVIIAVSEGIRLSEGGYAAGAFQSGVDDAFGHRYLSGVGKYLEQLVRDQLRCKVRSVELNVMQRCASHLASATDLAEAEQIGAAAFQAVCRGESGCMMTMQRAAGVDYAISFGTVPAEQVANRTRPFPTEWIAPEGNTVLDAAIAYYMPLIQGEVPPVMHNGLPKHLALPELSHPQH